MILGLMALEDRSWRRDPDFPCDDYKMGAPSIFAECQTDGHHLCELCVWNVRREGHKP